MFISNGVLSCRWDLKWLRFEELVELMKIGWGMFGVLNWDC